MVLPETLNEVDAVQAQVLDDVAALSRHLSKDLSILKANGFAIYSWQS